LRCCCAEAPGFIGSTPPPDGSRSTRAGDASPVPGAVATTVAGSGWVGTSHVSTTARSTAITGSAGIGCGSAAAPLGGAGVGAFRGDASSVTSALSWVSAGAEFEAIATSAGPLAGTREMDCGDEPARVWVTVPCSGGLATGASVVGTTTGAGGENKTCNSDTATGRSQKILRLGNPSPCPSKISRKSNVCTSSDSSDAHVNRLRSATLGGASNWARNAGYGDAAHSGYQGCVRSALGPVELTTVGVQNSFRRTFRAAERAKSTLPRLDAGLTARAAAS
jgi:hypothetical protein